MELLRARVPEGTKPMTVGRFLEGPLGVSVTLVRRLKMVGGITLNGAVVKSNHPVVPGDEVVLRMDRPREAPNVTPEPVPLAVVHEDEDVIVLDKAPGVVVHPTHGVYGGTLANGLAHRFLQRGEPSAIHPVHRLDRDTSGLVVFARHPLAHQRLYQQILNRTMERSYVALVLGLVEADEGTIDQPIGLRGDHPTARAVREAGQPAQTSYEVLERFELPALGLPEASMLRLKLATGRTHQIRVHLSWLGHPLLGDDLYGARRDQRMPRQALHAGTLGFHHPRTDAWTVFYSPWPGDLGPTLDALMGDDEAAF